MMRALITIAFAILVGSAAVAQTSVTLGEVGTGSGAPIEVDAENLTVDQASGQAVFSGSVVVSQGDLRIAAGSVTVQYDDESGQITGLVAGQGVTFVTPTDAAEAQRAEYDLIREYLVLTGGVLLSQGSLAISADRMEINMKTGSAQLTGNVRTVFGGQ